MEELIFPYALRGRGYTKKKNKSGNKKHKSSSKSNKNKQKIFSHNFLDFFSRYHQKKEKKRRCSSAFTY